MNDVKTWGLGGGLSGDLREDLARSLSPQGWVELVEWGNEGMAFEAQSQSSEFGLYLLAAKGLVGWTDKPAGRVLPGADAKAEWTEQGEHWGEISVKGKREHGSTWAGGQSRQSLSPAHSQGCAQKAASPVGKGQALAVHSHGLGPPQGRPGLSSQDEHLRSPGVETARGPRSSRRRGWATDLRVSRRKSWVCAQHELAFIGCRIHPPRSASFFHLTFSHPAMEVL